MPQQSYPVYFYIHGGGYQAGSGNLWYNGIFESFTSTGMIVVSINYRLNAFGKILCISRRLSFSNSELNPVTVFSANIEIPVQLK